MAVSRSLTIRVDDETRDILERLSERMGISQTAVLEVAARDLERSLDFHERFLVGLTTLMHDLGHLPHAEVANLSTALLTLARTLGGDCHEDSQKRIITGSGVHDTKTQGQKVTRNSQTPKRDAT